MTPTEQIIVYDTMTTISDIAPRLVQILTEHGSLTDVRNYKSAIYASVVRLGSLFTAEELAEHKTRHQKIKDDADKFFAAHKANNPPR